MTWRDKNLSVKQAFRAIETARDELNRIENQLTLANMGEPYLRVGGICSPDACVISEAFGDLERLANAKNELLTDGDR